MKSQLTKLTITGALFLLSSSSILLINNNTALASGSVFAGTTSVDTDSLLDKLNPSTRQQNQDNSDIDPDQFESTDLSQAFSKERFDEAVEVIGSLFPGNKKLTEELSSIRAQITTLSKEKEEALEKVNNLSSRNATLRESVLSSEQTINTLKEKKKKLKKENEELEASGNKLWDLSRKKAAEVEDLKSKQEQLAQEQTALAETHKQELEELKAQHDESLQDLKNKLSQSPTQEQIDQLKKEYTQKAKSYFEKVKEQHAAEKKALANQNQALWESDQLESERKEQLAQQQMALAETHKQELEKLKNQQTKDLQALKNQLNESPTQGQIQQLKSELSDQAQLYQSQINELKKQHATEKKALADQSQALWESGQLQSEKQDQLLDEHKKQLLQQQTALTETHKQELNTLKTQHAESLQDLQHSVAQLEKEKDNLTQEKKRLRNQAEFSTNQLISAHGDVAQQQESLSELQKSLDKQLAEVTELKNSLSNNSLEIEKYKQDLEAIRSENQVLSQNQRNQEEIDLYNQQIAQLKAKNDGLQQEQRSTLSNLENRHQTIEQLEKQIASKQQEINEKEQLISQYQDNIAAAEQGYKDLEEEHNQVTAQLLAAQDGLADAEKEIDSNNQEIQRLQKEKADAEKNAAQAKVEPAPQQEQEAIEPEMSDVTNSDESADSARINKTLSQISSGALDSVDIATESLFDKVAERIGHIPIASGDDEQCCGYSVWVKGTTASVQQKETKRHTPYKANLNGTSFGADVKLESGNVFGVGVALDNKSKLLIEGPDLVNESLKITSSTDVFSLYGKAYFSERIFASGIVSYAHSKIKTLDNLSGAETNSKSHSHRAQARIHYEKSFDNGVSLVPFMGMDYTNSSHSSFNYAASTADQEIVVGKQKRSILSASVGGNLFLPELYLNANNSLSIRPSLFVSATRPIISTLPTRFVQDEESQQIALQRTRIHRDITTNLGVSVRARYYNIDLTAYYKASLRNKYRAHQGSVKVEVKI